MRSHVRNYSSAGCKSGRSHILASNMHAFAMLNFLGSRITVLIWVCTAHSTKGSCSLPGALQWDYRHNSSRRNDRWFDLNLWAVFWFFFFQRQALEGNTQLILIGLQYKYYIETIICICSLEKVKHKHKHVDQSDEEHCFLTWTSSISVYFNQEPN